MIIQFLLFSTSDVIVIVTSVFKTVVFFTLITIIIQTPLPKPHHSRCVRCMLWISQIITLTQAYSFFLGFTLQKVFLYSNRVINVLRNCQTQLYCQLFVIKMIKLNVDWQRVLWAYWTIRQSDTFMLFCLVFIPLIDSLFTDE